LAPSSATIVALGEEADRMPREMKFFMSFPWHYDPCGIISEMRVKNKSIPYVHEARPEVEKFTNQTVWEPNTLVVVEQQDSISHCISNNHATGPEREKA
jgi:hypothetical protein